MLLFPIPFQYICGREQITRVQSSCWLVPDGQYRHSCAHQQVLSAQVRLPRFKTKVCQMLKGKEEESLAQEGLRGTGREERRKDSLLQPYVYKLPVSTSPQSKSS